LSWCTVSPRFRSWLSLLERLYRACFLVLAGGGGVDVFFRHFFSSSNKKGSSVLFLDPAQLVLYLYLTCGQLRFIIVLSVNNSKKCRLFLRLCSRPIFCVNLFLQMFRSAALTLGDWVAIPGTGCEFVTIQPYDFVPVTFHHSACGVI